jgi:DNA repair protein RecO (recombination protein O)
MIIQTQGIVLKSFDFRETSKIATFFTLHHGKVKGVLKGIRKDPKKFGSQVDRFTENDIVYYQYRNSDLHLVSQCDIKQFFYPVRQDYRKSLAANYALELIDAIMAVEQSNEGVYRLLLDFLAGLEEAKDVGKLVHMFQVKILTLSGFRPHIDACVKCGAKITGQARFSMRLGGLVCPLCPTSETTFMLVSRGAISSMLHIEKTPWKTAVRLGLTPSVRKELKYILNNFLVYHLEKRIKSEKLLSENLVEV